MVKGHNIEDDIFSYRRIRTTSLLRELENLLTGSLVLITKYKFKSD